MTGQERAEKTYGVYEHHKTEAGVKDIDVANATGLSPSVLSDWKSGRYTPKIEKLALIARCLGFSLEEFII